MNELEYLSLKQDHAIEESFYDSVNHCEGFKREGFKQPLYASSTNILFLRRRRRRRLR